MYVTDLGFKSLSVTDFIDPPKTCNCRYTSPNNKTRRETQIRTELFSTQVGTKSFSTSKTTGVTNLHIYDGTHHYIMDPSRYSF